MGYALNGKEKNLMNKPNSVTQVFKTEIYLRSKWSYHLIFSSFPLEACFYLVTALQRLCIIFLYCI